MKDITKKIFLISGIIFAVVSIIHFILVGSLSGLIAGLTISLISVLFNFIYKVKWNDIARESLFNACNEIKSFGNSLPLKFLGKLQFLWIFIMVLVFFKPLCTALFPGVPIVLFTVLNNIAFSFFVLGTFYQILQGNLKGISLTSGIFAIYNILDVIISFATEKSLTTKSMCLFLVFWAIYNIFATMLPDTPPVETVKVKKEKPKKEKKVKKTEEELEIEENNKETLEKLKEQESEESQES